MSEQRYALIRNAAVENILLWDGVNGETWVAPRLPDLPPEQEGTEPTPRFMEQPEDWVPFSRSFGEGAQLLAVPDEVGIGWSYSDGEFKAPPEAAVPISREQNDGEKEGRLLFAAARIAPLQDAVDLEEATPEEEAQLKAWKKYRVAVNRMPITEGQLDWPEMPGG